MSQWHAVFASLLLVICIPGETAAESAPTQTDTRWRFDVEALTDFPLQIGAAAHLETPQRIRFHTSLGVMPSPYIDTINAVSVEAGWYDEMTAELIAAALEQSLVWRLRAGWRPFGGHGFYFATGYTLAALGGGLSGAETISAVTGINLPTGTNARREFNLVAHVHMLDIVAGWEWLFADAFVLRAAIGGTFTVSSNTTADPSWNVRPIARSAINELMREGAAYIDDTIENYVHTPTLTLAFGYRF